MGDGIPGKYKVVMLYTPSINMSCVGEMRDAFLHLGAHKTASTYINISPCDVGFAHGLLAHRASRDQRSGGQPAGTQCARRHPLRLSVHRGRMRRDHRRQEHRRPAPPSDAVAYDGRRIRLPPGHRICFRTHTTASIARKTIRRRSDCATARSTTSIRRSDRPTARSGPGTTDICGHGEPGGEKPPGFSIRAVSWRG